MKISVIIPIYNAKSYIRSIIENILKSNYQELELILDGSKDNSEEICREYINDK